MKARQCRYQSQDTEMTLREGIQEYYEANPHLLLPEKLDSEAALFFHNHDRIHVVFGCDTSLSQEFRADFWTMLGSDVSLRRYFKYLNSSAVKALVKDAQERYSKRGARTELRKALLSGIKAPFEVFFRTCRMKKKWAWDENERYIDKPLKEIRTEFGIKVL